MDCMSFVIFVVPTFNNRKRGVTFFDQDWCWVGDQLTRYGCMILMTNSVHLHTARSSPAEAVGGAAPCCESTGDLQTSVDPIHRSGERWTKSTLISYRTRTTSEMTDWCIVWDQIPDHSAFLELHESYGSPSGVRAITVVAKSIEAAR